ncbi:MAG: 30S ribosomal protein S4e [Nanoarchaeota archaeon]
MVSHLKRMATPKTWHINRKKNKFVTKPAPGPHSSDISLALGTLVKEVFNYAATTREVKKILNANSVKVDGTVRKDFRFPVGIFDTVEFSNGKHFRLILNKKGKIDTIETSKEESSMKPAKIIGKAMVKGKVQLNFYDGKNKLAEKNDYKVGDSVMLSLPDQKISKHLKLQKKATIFLTSGKHVGETGKIEDIAGNKIIYKDHNGELVETLKEYAFVIGEDKPLIALDKK